MARRPQTFTNPFYVLLVAASLAFTVTVMGYLAGLMIHQQALAHPREGPGPGSLALAHWFDRTGPTALAIELGVMLVSGCTAMATDRWFLKRQGDKVTR